jgi:hypothetical protein
MGKFYELFFGLRILLSFIRVLGRLEAVRRKQFLSFVTFVTKLNSENLQNLINLPQPLISRKIEQLLHENHETEYMLASQGLTNENWQVLAKKAEAFESPDLKIELAKLREHVLMLERKVDQQNNLKALLENSK